MTGAVAPLEGAPADARIERVSMIDTTRRLWLPR